jgi:two-component system LytT family response regulator
MNILIIEDETIAAERIKELVQKTISNAHIVGVCDSIEQSVQFLHSHGMPELILMDIELVDGQSFEIFREVDVTCPVIFTTAYDEYALQAFKVHSIDYILKPIQQEDLQRSMDKLRQLKTTFENKTVLDVDALLKMLHRTTIPAGDPHRERFLVRKGQQLLSIPIEETAYFFSEEKVTFLKAADGQTYALDLSLEEVEQQVDPNRFFRGSRKYLIGRRAINSVYADFNGKYRIILKPDAKEEVIVSRDRAAAFRKWLGD